MPKKTPSVDLNKYMAEEKNKDNTPPKNKKNSNKQVPPNQDFDPAIVKVIRDALFIHLNSPENLVKRKTSNELDAMVATCQEFMQSFVIIGYNMNGQPVPPIVFAHNQQEADALGSYMSKFIQSTIKEVEPPLE